MDTALNLRDLPQLTLADLATCTFASSEVYTRVEDMRVRIVSLDKALTLSRSSNVETVLALNTIEGFKSIRTKVLGLTVEGVYVENNQFIPMHAIYSVNIE